MGVSVRGCEVTVRFGRIGAAGQARTRALVDEEAARRHAEGLVAEKTRKGYAPALWG